MIREAREVLEVARGVDVTARRTGDGDPQVRHVEQHLGRAVRCRDRQRPPHRRRAVGREQRVGHAVVVGGDRGADLRGCGAQRRHEPLEGRAGIRHVAGHDGHDGRAHPQQPRGDPGEGTPARGVLAGPGDRTTALALGSDDDHGPARRKRVHHGLEHGRPVQPGAQLVGTEPPRGPPGEHDDRDVGDLRQHAGPVARGRLLPHGAGRSVVCPKGPVDPSVWSALTAPVWGAG